MNLTDSFQLRQMLAQSLVGAMICLAVTAPPISLSSALPYFKVEQLLLPFAIGVYVWLLLAGVARTIRFNGLFLVGFFFCICNAVSIWYGEQVLGHSVVLRDYYELPKAWLPVAFFTLAYEAELSDGALRRLITVFSFAVLPVCFYAWAQSAGLGFTYKLNSYYSGGGHIDEALKYAGRVFSTMGNANVLGQLMTWCIVLFLLAAMFSVGNRLLNFFVALACLITLVMTGSRFGFLTVGVGFVLVLGLVSLGGRRNLRQVSLLLLLLPIFIGTYETVASSNRRTLERYQTLRNPLQIDSLRERLDNLWLQEWGDFKKSPLVGHGPAKSFYTTGFSDSEYLGVLREKGLIGFFVFLGYYLYPLYLLQKGERDALVLGDSMKAQAPAALVVLHAASIFGVLALLMNLGMSTFYSPFLQAFLWLWLGLGVRCAATVRMSRSLVHMLPTQRDRWAQDTVASY